MDLLVRMLNIRNFVQMYLGKHSNKIKTNWNQWQEYTYIHKHINNKQEILHSQSRREVRLLLHNIGKVHQVMDL